MISMARTFGAPDRVPAGNPPINASNASSPSASRPSTLDEICMTWLARSITNCSVTLTDPSADTRPPPPQPLGGGGDHGKPAKVEITHERRRIDPPQRAIQRERRQHEGHG